MSIHIPASHVQPTKRTTHHTLLITSLELLICDLYLESLYPSIRSSFFYSYSLLRTYFFCTALALMLPTKKPGLISNASPPQALGAHKLSTSPSPMAFGSKSFGH